LGKILEARGLSRGAVLHAEGSAELALLLGSEDAARVREEFIQGATAVLGAPDFADAVRFAESRKGDREVVRSELSFFAQTLASQARQHVAREPLEAERLAARHHLVLSAMDDIDRNVQPALVLETLFARMRGATV
jgi:hypothetical protein